MNNHLTRRGLTAMGLAALAAPILGKRAQAKVPNANLDVAYLEGLILPADMPYLPPSRLHPAYSHAVYVNAALSGAGAQKMWVLAREGGCWRLAFCDVEHWGAMADPTYSGPVSTGRIYTGDRRSGPTPPGIFNIDERQACHRPGWGSAGMYNALYIDLHYSGGRASGVAIHGTLEVSYHQLEQADSHDCVRIRQAVADKIWAILHPEGAWGTASPLWGEVPRFFRSEVRGDMSARSGYIRDGSLLRAADGSVLMRPGYSMVFVFFRDDL